MYVLIKYFLQLDCFDLTTTAIYQAQSETIAFTGYLDHSLPVDELSICQNEMIGKRYSMQVFVGPSIFFINDIIFDGANETLLTLSCQIASDCTYAEISKYTIGSYLLNFLDIDMSVQGTFGQLFFRVYDHTQCHSQAVMNYYLNDALQSFFVELKPHTRCIADPQSTNFSTSFNMTVEGTESLITKLIGDTTIPVDANYIQNVLMFGKPCFEISDEIEKINCQNEQRVFVNANAVLIHAIIQNDIQLDKTGHPCSYLQTFKIDIGSYNNRDFEDDCIKQVRAIFFDNFIQLYITPGAFLMCGRTYFETHIKYSRVNVTVVVNQNQDFSQFIFEEYIVMDDFMHPEETIQKLDCKETSNVSRCENGLKTIQNISSNASIQLILNFMDEDTINYQIITKVAKYTPIQDNCTVEFYSNYICFSFPTDSMTQLDTIILEVQNLKLSYDAQFQSGQTRYCFNTTEDFYEITILEGAKISVGSDDIPQVFMDFVLSGKQHIYVAGVFACCFVIGAITLITRYFVLRRMYLK